MGKGFFAESAGTLYRCAANDLKVRLPWTMLHHKQTFYHLKEKAYFLFAICSKSPQRNSIFIRYNKGAVREDHSERAPPKNLQTQARMIAANAAPLKHCPPPMRGNSQRRRTDYQTPPDSRKCLGVHHTDRQHRFLLLSTVAACLFVFPFLKQSAKRHGTFCSVPFGVLGKRSAQVAQAVGGKMSFQGFPPGVEAVVP